MLLRPLFFTSFLIDDQLADDGLTERGPIVISSASSKTAIAAAFLLAQREGVELVGLTSPRSVEFVEGLGIYDRTVTYDDDRLARARAPRPTSTSPATARCARRSTPTSATSSSTAWRWASPTGRTSAPARGELPGPTPTFFFAPDRVVKRSADWGRAGLEQAVADAWHPFCEWTGGWLETIPGQGFDGLQERLPRGARGPRRPEDRPRDLSSAGAPARR